MPDEIIILYVLLVLLIIACTTFLIISFVQKPSWFVFPYFQHTFDVSGRRVVDIYKLIDAYIINGGFNEIGIHEKKINNWKASCTSYIAGIKWDFLKQYRQKQYESILDEAHAYMFTTIRKQTRYKQENYQRFPYIVENIDKEFSFSYYELSDRNRKLRNINYESTLADYNNKQQRKLLTKDLRKQIMERDEYTCRYCGKYMPDEIGLHIDHIIPITKGGKTVASNLQVLCSKCNGFKSNKITD